MAEATQVIEMIKRIIADDTADLRERVQHLESRTPGKSESENGERYSQTSMADPAVGEALTELQARLTAIKEMHTLDATPVQWTRSNDGKMVEAPEGMWDITCLACNHKTVWREGDKKPPQCKTWRLADGQTVQ